MDNDRILRTPDVVARCGIGRSTIYKFVAAGRFPEPVKLGMRAVGWRESAVNAWMAGLNYSDQSDRP